MASTALQYSSSSSSHKQQNLKKTVIEYEMCVFVFYTNLSETFLILTKTERDMYTGLQVLFLSDFIET